MTVSTTDLVAAVTKLNDLTRRKLVTWTPETKNSSRNNDVISAYTAPFEGRTFRITEFRSPPQERRYDKSSKERCKLEILDDQDGIIFEFPDVQGIADLCRSVQLRHTDVEDLIRSLINSK